MEFLETLFWVLISLGAFSLIGILIFDVTKLWWPQNEALFRPRWLRRNRH